MPAVQKIPRKSYCLLIDTGWILHSDKIRGGECDAFEMHSEQAKPVVSPGRKVSDFVTHSRVAWGGTQSIVCLFYI